MNQDGGKYIDNFSVDGTLVGSFINSHLGWLDGYTFI